MISVTKIGSVNYVDFRAYRELEKQNAHLTANNKYIIKCNAEHTSIHNELLHRFHSLENENRELIEKNIALENEKKTLLDASHEASKIYWKLYEENTESKMNLKQEMERKKELIASYTVLLEEKIELTKNNETIKYYNENNIAAYKIILEENLKLRDELQRHKSWADDYIRVVQHQSEWIKEENIKIKEQHKSLFSSWMNVKADFECLTRDFNKLQAENKELTQKCKRQGIEIFDKDIKIRSLMNQIESLKETLKHSESFQRVESYVKYQLEENRHKLIDYNNALTAELDSLREKLTTSIAGSQLLSAGIRSLNYDLKDMAKNRQELEDINKKLEEHRNALIEEIARLKKQDGQRPDTVHLYSDTTSWSTAVIYTAKFNDITLCHNVHYSVSKERQIQIVIDMFKTLLEKVKEEKSGE